MQRKSLLALSAGALLLCAGTMDQAQAQYRWRVPGGGGFNHGWHNAGWGGGWRGGWGGWRGGGWNGGWGAFGAGALVGAATSLVTAPLWSGGYGYGYDAGYPGYAAYSYPAYDYGYAAPVAYETVPVVYRQRVVVRQPVVYRTRYVAPRRYYAAPVYRRAYVGWAPRRHYVTGPAVVRAGYGNAAWRYHRRVY